MRHLVATALLAAAASSAGCTLSAPDEEATDAVVDPRVTVLPELTGMVVTDDAITIPRDGNGSLASLAVGDILISTTGEGFLRRIDALTPTAGAFAYATSDAELTDALVSAQLATSLGGEGKADTHQLPTVGFSIRDRVVLDNPSITARLTRASVSFSPELDLDVNIDDSHVESFEMVVRGRISGALEFDIEARDAAVGPEIVLWQSPPAIFYQQVGLLPVVETVTTSVVFKLQATAKGHGTVRITADALSVLAGGVRYTRADGWDPVSTATLTTHGAIPEASVTFEQLGVRGWLAVRTDVRLYGLAGPFIAAGPQAEVSRNLQTGKFDAAVGFRAAAGGGLKFFRFNVPAMPAYDLFDVTKPIL